MEEIESHNTSTEAEVPDTWADFDDGFLPSEPAPSPKKVVFAVDDPWDAWGWAAPREFLTGALFGAQKRGHELMLNEVINTNTNVQLIATGESLFQYDLDVFMLVAHKGRTGDQISFRVRDFVVELRGGKAPSSRARKSVKQRPPIDSVGGSSGGSALKSILRMSNFMVDLRVNNKAGSPAYSYCGRLIHEATVMVEGKNVPISDEIVSRKDLSELAVNIKLNPEMAVLFEKRRRVYFNPETRRRFSTSPLVLWLYAFLRSNSSPFDLPLSYFLQKCGSSSKSAEFRRMMIVARKRLRQAKLIYSSKMVKGGRLHFDIQKPVVTKKIAKATAENPTRLVYCDPVHELGAARDPTC